MLVHRECLYGETRYRSPFFYMYVFIFSDLHVSLPFDEFTMDVIWSLNVAPTQIHPNTWVSIQAFRLLGDALRLHPSPSSFLSYYTSHPAQPVSWHSLIGWSVFFSILSPSLIKSSKRGLLRLLFGRRRRPISLTRLVGLGFPSTGLANLVTLRSGRGRWGVPMS